MRRNVVRLNPGVDLSEGLLLQMVSSRRPVPAAPLRTGRAPFSASGSPTSESSGSRIGKDLRITRPCHCHQSTSSICRPSPCSGRYPDRSSTMAAPSPWDSRPVGDPAFTLMRRLARLGCPVRFLQPVHYRSLTVESFRIPLVWTRGRCHRFRDASVGENLHRWKPRVLRHHWLLLGFNQFRFRHACRTCRLTRLHPFTLSCFTAMLRSPLSFDIRSGSCPKRYALHLLLFLSYLMGAVSAPQGGSWFLEGACPMNAAIHNVEAPFPQAFASRPQKKASSLFPGASGYRRNSVPPDGRDRQVVRRACALL